MSGPTTKDTSTLALGLAKVSILASASNIANPYSAAVAGDSLGAITKSLLTLDFEFWKHMAGFPQKEDYNICLSKAAKIEADAEELTPFNMALASGIDPTTYTNVHSGMIPLGALSASAYVRTELQYVFPSGSYKMDVIFPRAQCSNSISADFQAKENIKVPLTIEAKNAESAVSGGHVVWDVAPLGRIWFGTV
jgi:hypothetical protein